MSAEPVRLHPDDLAALADMVAHRVVELLPEAAPAASLLLLTAADVARRFGVSADWVRENADRLGVIRLGDGPRPRLRFDADRVAAALSSRPGGGESPDAGTGSTTGPAPLRRRREGEEPPGQLPVRSVDPGALPKRTARRGGNLPGPATRNRPSTQTKRSPGGPRPPARCRPPLDAEDERRP